MVVLEAFGLAAAELFAYNKEVYKFDNEQRIEKDLARVEMQIKRFDLFRQDIEDLVELTVSKMDMYHMVGALLLSFTCSIYTEGLFRGLEPPWFTGLYFMSTCGGFVYLLLAVWFSMHASVQAQSYGVRLRTRFIRLPIPNLNTITDLTSRMADFEKQGIGSMMRMPFSGNAPAWLGRSDVEHRQEEARRPGEWWKDGSQSGVGGGIGGSAMTLGSGGSQGAPELVSAVGDKGFGKAEVLDKAAEGPGKHVQLFRRLQAKWQCYDAYARVSMSLGVLEIIQSVNFFVVGSTLVERAQPSCAVAVTIVLQVLSLGLMQLDIAAKPISNRLPLGRGVQVVIIQLFGSAPIVLTLIMLITSRELREEAEGAEEIMLARYDKVYIIAPLAYFFKVVWFNLMLITAWPSQDDASLPRKFLSVLFLDVFGDGTYDPTEAEQAPTLGNQNSHDSGNRVLQETRVAAAEHALDTAHGSLRRWEAVPHDMLMDSQGPQLENMRRDYMFWRDRLHTFVAERKRERGVAYHGSSRDYHELKSWAELSRMEKNEDKFRGTLVGPLKKRNTIRSSTCYYDLDNDMHLVDKAQGHPVLAISEVGHEVEEAVDQVKHALAGSAEDAARQGSPQVNKGSTFFDPAAHANKAERLPWRTLRRMTMLLAFCWCFLGIQLAMHVTGMWDIRWMYSRRLADFVGGEADVQAEELFVSWPHGGFFRPESLHRLPGSAENATELLVASKYATHAAKGLSGDAPLDVTAAPLLRSAFPHNVVTMCAAPPEAGLASGVPRCWLGALDPQGVALWPLGHQRAAAVVLPVQGPPWQALAGAMLPCSEAFEAAAAGAVVPPADAAECLVLVGWDGQRLPIAFVPLDGAGLGSGSVGSLPPRAAVRPRLDAAMGDSAFSQGAQDIAALHVEPASGRLSALMRTPGQRPALFMWSLLGGHRSLGQWQLPTQIIGDVKPPPEDCSSSGASPEFEATAMCEDGKGNIVVAGLRGADETPELWRLNFGELSP